MWLVTLTRSGRQAQQRRGSTAPTVVCATSRQAHVRRDDGPGPGLTVPAVPRRRHARAVNAVVTSPRTAVGRRLIATAVVTLVAVLVLTSPAAAHSELLGSDPAQGAIVSGPQMAVQLKLASAITDELAQVVVTGPDGTDLALGPPRVAGSTVIQPLREANGDGTYRVAYRVVADDGHPIIGTLAFSRRASAAPSAPAPTQESSATSTPPTPAVGSGAAGGDDGRPAAGAWVMGAVLTLGVGGVILARRASAVREGNAARRTAST